MVRPESQNACSRVEPRIRIFLSTPFISSTTRQAGTGILHLVRVLENLNEATLGTGDGTADVFFPMPMVSRTRLVADDLPAPTGPTSRVYAVGRLRGFSSDILIPRPACRAIAMGYA